MKRSFARPREEFLQLGSLPVSLNLGRYHAEILYWGFFEPRFWRNYLHTHSFFEVCYAYSGEGTFRMLGQDYRVRAGDVFVAKPSEPHKIISSRKNPLGIYFWAYTLVPSTTRSGSDTGTDALLNAFAASKLWVSRAPRSMQPTLSMLADEASTRRPGYTRAIESLTGKLLLDTARAVAGDNVKGEIVEPPASDPSDAIIRTAMQYLRDNFARPIALRDVAAQVHISERHLARLFAAETRRSVIDQLVDIRLGAAKQLLLDRDQPIKSVAAAVGYPDVRYFMTLFRKQTATTPARWRASGGTNFLGKSRGKITARARRSTARG